MLSFWKNISSGQRILIGVIGLFFILVFLSEILNNRFWLNDFKVYYEAAQTFKAGNSMYNEAFGLSSGLYKYAPIALLPIIPFTLFDYLTASIIFFFILAAAYLFMVVKVPTVVHKQLGLQNADKRKWLIPFFGFLVIASHSHRELHLGNVNILLLALAFACWQGFLKKKEIQAAFLLSIVILFKPHFLILLILCLVWKKWRIAGFSSLFIFIGLLLPALWLGWNQNSNLLAEWGATMAGHSDNLLGSVNTIYYYPVKYYESLAPENSGRFIALVFVLIAGVLAVFTHFKLFRSIQNIKEEKSNLFMFEFFVVLAIIPSLTITDTEHFVLAFPLIIYGLTCMRFSANKWIKGIFILGLFFYGGDWGDLMGEFNQIMGKYGLIGLGNLIIILASLYFHKERISASSTIKMNQ